MWSDVHLRSVRLGRQMKWAKQSREWQKKMQKRMASSQTGAEKVVSPHIGFYKTFTRPIAKVLLMATFTYQLAYWGWVKLEKDEIKKERTAEVEVLEKQLRELTEKKSVP